MGNLTRRTAMGGLAAGLAGCKLYSDVPPVVLGGTPVAPDATIMAALRASSEHRRLVAALDATNLDDRLESAGPFTLFAPTDEAFEWLRPKRTAKLISEDQSALRQTLLNHIVPARLDSEELLAAIPKMNGKTKVFALNNEVVRISGERDALKLFDMRKRSMKIVTADAIASNGYIHAIDGVLLPRDDAFVSP